MPHGSERPETIAYHAFGNRYSKSKDYFTAHECVSAHDDAKLRKTVALRRKIWNVLKLLMHKGFLPSVFDNR